MNLEASSTNLNSVKNELRLPSEDIDPYALVHLFERCKNDGSLDDAIRLPRRQDRNWGLNRMNSSSTHNNNDYDIRTPGGQRRRASRGRTQSKAESSLRSKQVEKLEVSASQRPDWFRIPDPPAVNKTTDDKWLLPEQIEERFMNVMNLIGDREKYGQHEYVREWLSERQGQSDSVVEPMLWHIHRFDPPGFIITTTEFPDGKMLIDLLRTLRHPHLAYRKKTICIIADAFQIESLVAKLTWSKISVVVLKDNLSQDSQGTGPVLASNSVFLTAHARYVGIPLDNLINYQMFRTANQYLERTRLLRRRGHMTTLFNPRFDSKLVPCLVKEMRIQKIEVPAFLKQRSGENTEVISQ